MSINKVPSYLLNGEVSPLPNTVPVRNEDGNLYTGGALGFKTDDYEIPLIMNEEGHIESGTNTCWDSGNTPIEDGSFIARLTGFGDTNGLNFIFNECYYRRMGNIVHVDMRIQFTFSAKGGAPSTAQVRVEGLPYVFPKYTGVNLCFATGVNLNNSSRQLFSYIHPDGGIAFLSEDLSSGPSTFHVLTSANFIKGDITNPVIDVGLSFTGRLS